VSFLLLIVFIEFDLFLLALYLLDYNVFPRLLFFLSDSKTSLMSKYYAMRVIYFMTCSLDIEPPVIIVYNGVHILIDLFDRIVESKRILVSKKSKKLPIENHDIKSTTKNGVTSKGEETFVVKERTTEEALYPEVIENNYDEDEDDYDSDCDDYPHVIQNKENQLSVDSARKKPPPAKESLFTPLSSTSSQDRIYVELLEKILSILGNLCVDFNEIIIYRSLLIDFHILEYIDKLINILPKDSKYSHILITRISWFYHVFFQFQPFPTNKFLPFSITLCNLLSLIVNNTNTSDVVRASSLALAAFLSESPNYVIKLILTKICPNFLLLYKELIEKYKNDEVTKITNQYIPDSGNNDPHAISVNTMRGILSLIGCFAEGSDTYKQLLIDNNYLTVFSELLNPSTSHIILIATLWVLSNIVDCTSEDILYSFLHSDLLSRIIPLFHYLSDDFTVRWYIIVLFGRMMYTIEVLSAIPVSPPTEEGEATVASMLALNRSSIQHFLDISEPDLSVLRLVVLKCFDCIIKGLKKDYSMVIMKCTNLMASVDFL
jgi:hypothetical protein